MALLIAALALIMATYNLIVVTRIRKTNDAMWHQIETLENTWRQARQDEDTR